MPMVQEGCSCFFQSALNASLVTQVLRLGTHTGIQERSALQVNTVVLRLLICVFLSIAGFPLCVHSKTSDCDVL
jgi:hypothetical protein